MIFLDNNATTKLLPEVLQAMLYDLDGIPRNPSSITFYGREARDKISSARRDIAAYLGVLPEEVIFTSGGTESTQMLIHGFYKKNPGPIIGSAIDHACVTETLKQYNTIYLKIDERGAPQISDIEALLSKAKPSFIILSGANTETGVMLELEEVAELCERNNVPLIIDGVGLLGKTNFTPLPKGISAISFSGHKCHGPKGIGIAIVGKKYKIPPMLVGGHQERGMRAGTENLPGILGLAKAIELIDPNGFQKVQLLRDHFEALLFEKFPNFTINGLGKRLPNTSNIYFEGIDAETLLMNLDQKGVIASLGSACSAGALEPSQVLLGMGYPQKRALSSLRFSLSRFTTLDEIERAAAIITKLCEK